MQYRGLRSGAPALPAYDPAVLALSGWWRAGGYNGSTTWSGAASAGTSGSHDLTASGGQAPTNGGSLSGHTVVAFDGSAVQNFTGAAASSFITTTAWSLWTLVDMVSEDTDSGTGWQNAALVADVGTNWGLFVRSTGPTAQLFQAATATTTFANGSWALLQARFNGTNLEARTNNASWNVIASGNASVSGALAVGRNFFTGKAITGSIADIGLATTRFSDATFDNLYSYAKSRYPGAGLP